MTMEINIIKVWQVRSVAELGKSLIKQLGAGAG